MPPFFCWRSMLPTLESPLLRPYRLHPPLSTPLCWPCHCLWKGRLTCTAFAYYTSTAVYCHRVKTVFYRREASNTSKQQCPHISRKFFSIGPQNVRACATTCRRAAACVRRSLVSRGKKPIRTRWQPNRCLPGRLVIVAFETSRETGMGGRGAYGVTVGVMAFQAFAVLLEPLVDLGVQPDRRPVHAEIVAISASGSKAGGQYRERNDKPSCLHARPSLRPSFNCS